MNLAASGCVSSACSVGKADTQRTATETQKHSQVSGVVHWSIVGDAFRVDVDACVDQQLRALQNALVELFAVDSRQRRWLIARQERVGRQWRHLAFVARVQKLVFRPLACIRLQHRNVHDCVVEVVTIE